MPRVENGSPLKLVESKPNKQLEVLRRRTDFQEIQKSGRKIRATEWLTICSRRHKAGYLRYGLTVSRKVGSAVIRNRLKRLSREYFRRAVHEGKGWDNFEVVIIFRSMPQEYFKRLKLSQLSEFFDKGVERLCRHD